MKQNNKYQKLELTWVGKGEEPQLEPRILIENPEYSYGDKDSQNMIIHGDNLLALKALEQEYAGKVKIGKLNLDENISSGDTYGIQSIPTLLFFKDGELIDNLIGFQSGEALKQKIDSLL